MIEDTPSVALARRSLADARVDLDHAVRSLSDSGVETVMASSNLMGLLLRVVTAKEHLDDVERGPNTGIPASLR